MSERFIAFVPGNRYLAVVGRETLTRRVQILDALNGRVFCELPGGDGPPMVMNASEKLLVYADLDGNLVAWNVNDFSASWRMSALALGKRRVPRPAVDSLKPWFSPVGRKSKNAP